tara:strand:- start:3539 stop:4114 length:576 start_codon:yes stop_codon:yes gene_type:complete
MSSAAQLVPNGCVGVTLYCVHLAQNVLLMQDDGMYDLDTKDLAILAILQKNAQSPALEIAETLGMSASQIGRRRHRLETEGYIQSTPAHLNAALLGLNVQAFIQIQTESQTAETHGSIATLIGRHPEIIAAWTLTGEADYIFRVFCRDLSRLNDLIQKELLPHPAIGRVQSQIVMDQLKDDSALPLENGRG